MFCEVRKLFDARKRQKYLRCNPKRNGPGGKKPHWTDYTKIQKELIEATREAMKALKDEEAKYGKKDYSFV